MIRHTQCLDQQLQWCVIIRFESNSGEGLVAGGKDGEGVPLVIGQKDISKPHLLHHLGEVGEPA